MSEPLIVADPKVMTGNPVIAGTRITVDLLLEKLGGGESIEAILDAHPRLTRDAGLAALRFAAQALRAEAVAEVCRLRAGELMGSFTVISPGQVRIRHRL